MKKYFSIFCLLFCGALLLLQPANAQKLYLGVDGGLSIPQLKSSGDNEISQGYSSRMAPVFGVFADIGVKDNFSIKTFINYAGQGGKRDGMQPIPVTPASLAQLLPPGTRLYANFNNEAILNYLEIPIMANLEWGHKWKYFVELGPYVGFLLNAKQKTSGNSQLYFDKEGKQPVSIMGQPLPPQSFDAENDVKNDINSTNFGITGGGGLAYCFNNPLKLYLDVRGAYGLTHIQKDTDKNGKSNTGGLFVTLGLAYALKK